MKDMRDSGSYNMKALKIGDLKAKVPLIQGGMGVGISLSSLAGAVALEGGIGVISTAQIGYREKDWNTNPIEANLRAIEKEIKKAKEISHGGIIAANIMVATKFYDRYVKAAIKAGVDIIISGAGLPMELPELAKGSNVKLVPVISSKKAARIIFKRWEKTNEVVPDAVVVEGPKAGGHLGFKAEEAQSPESLNYQEEIKNIIEFVKDYEEKYKKEIPVIVAGGITEKEDADKVFELGADGIQVATPFVTTKECDAHENFKMAYVNSRKEDIKIIKSPVGMPARAINNPFLERVKNLGRVVPVKCHQCVSTCVFSETPYCITDALVNAVKGKIDDGLIFCGADAYKLNKITTVKEVVRKYFPEIGSEH